MNEQEQQRMVALVKAALSTLNTLTTEQFARGGDRPARRALVQALAIAGQANSDDIREYGVIEHV